MAGALITLTTVVAVHDYRVEVGEMGESEKRQKRTGQ